MANKKSVITRIPYDIEQAFRKNYPGMLESVAAMEKQDIQGRSVLPLQSVMSEYSPFQPSDHVILSHALSTWSQHRCVYIFTPELRQALTAQRDDLTIDVAALMSLPFDGAYIDTSFSGSCVGVFATYSVMPDGVAPALMMGVLYSDGQFTGLPLPLRQGWTISRTVNVLVRQMVDAGTVPADETPEHVQQSTDSFLRWLIPMLLYLCADNADVRPSRQHTVTTGDKKPSLPFAQEVGTDFAIAVREFVRGNGEIVYVSSDDDDEPQAHIAGRRKRPHIRAGHYHHYWTGKKSEPQNRRLVLHWVAPVFVGKNENTVTQIEVKG